MPLCVLEVLQVLSSCCSSISSHVVENLFNLENDRKYANWAPCTLWAPASKRCRSCSLASARAKPENSIFGRRRAGNHHFYFFLRGQLFKWASNSRNYFFRRRMAMMAAKSKASFDRSRWISSRISCYFFFTFLMIVIFLPKKKLVLVHVDVVRCLFL